MSDKSRRKLLKSIAAGSGAIVAGKNLPESWSRPVVDSVMLPAHAETTTPTPITGPFAGASDNSSGMLDSDSLFAKAADSLIPEAQAGGEIRCNFIPNWYVCVELSDDLKTAKVTIYSDFGSNTILDSTSYTWPSVTVGGGESTDATFNDNVNNCEELNGVNLLDKMGLIKNSHADDVYRCTVVSVNGTARGLFDVGVGQGTFDVGPGTCNPTLNCADFDCNIG